MTRDPSRPATRNLHTVESWGIHDPHWRVEHCSHDFGECRDRASAALQQLVDTGGAGRFRVVTYAPVAVEAVPPPPAARGEAA